MTGTMFIFGMGYTASRLAACLRVKGWTVIGTRREAAPEAIRFDDAAAVHRAIDAASHILSTVPPFAAGGDPVLDRYGTAIASSGAQWIGYLSSTGVYGDTCGAWVDESAAVGSGRRSARARADIAWQEVQADICIFRLPGIYGPGRSALERVRDGRAHRINLPDQVFSRIHVDDIVSAIVASFDHGRGIFNLADDLPCSQNSVIEYASALLGLDPPPMQSLAEAALSPMARAFYMENRRIANGRAKRMLGWKPVYRDYRQGLDSLLRGPVIPV